MLLAETSGGPGLEASPSVLDGGGAHLPNRQTIIGLAKARKHLINVRSFGGVAEAKIGLIKTLKHLVNWRIRSGVGGGASAPGGAYNMNAWSILLLGESSQHIPSIPKIQTDWGFNFT